jgi:hypothetical protein
MANLPVNGRTSVVPATTLPHAASASLAFSTAAARGSPAERNEREALELA